MHDYLPEMCVRLFFNCQLMNQNLSSAEFSCPDGREQSKTPANLDQVNLQKLRSSIIYLYFAIRNLHRLSQNLSLGKPNLQLFLLLEKCCLHEGFNQNINTLVPASDSQWSLSVKHEDVFKHMWDLLFMLLWNLSF